MLGDGDVTAAIAVKGIEVVRKSYEGSSFNDPDGNIPAVGRWTVLS
jgi:hypothetical protein